VLSDEYIIQISSYNFGSENTVSTYETVKALLTRLGQTAALARLIPNEAAFADHPRDISMDTGKLRKAGIFFPTTAEGLYYALKKEATP
jgi:dTDP-4-dehydrorhamnose reductase